MTIVGIDLAVDARNCAISWGRLESGRLIVDRVAMAGSDEVLDSLLDGVEDRTVLLCIDAPLGWPAEMGRHLAEHRAGAAVTASANDLFRRETDRDIYRRYRKTPLDVGADRIARTALRALQLLSTLRGRTGREIDLPLTLDGIARPGIHVLETYPAGYLAARKFDVKGYRERGAVETRRMVLEKVCSAAGESLELGPPPAEFLPRADLLDSLLCAIAGQIAASGGSPPPTNRTRAAIEGWIWCG